MKLKFIMLGVMLLIAALTAKFFLSKGGTMRGSDGDKSKPVKSRASVDSLELTHDERNALIAKASDGDADAAYKLVLHYKMVELDNKTSDYWLNKAASAGHAEAQRWLEIDAKKPKLFNNHEAEKR